MKPTIDMVLEGLLAREGGYCNHPSDKGGETCFGITIDVARANGYEGEMEALPVQFAKDIYMKRYWHGPGFDDVSKVNMSVAEELFDTGVNMGPDIAAGFLQRALNLLNRNGKDYQNLKVDADIGPATILALKTFIDHRGLEGQTVLIKILNCLQGMRYIAIAEKNETQEDFIYGWFNGRIG